MKRNDNVRYVVSMFFNIALAVFAGWYIQHLGGTEAEGYLATFVAFSYNDLRDRIENKR